MSHEKEIRAERLAFNSAGFRQASIPLTGSPFFQKKTQATSRQDKDIAEARYRAVVKARKEKT